MAGGDVKDWVMSQAKDYARDASMGKNPLVVNSESTDPNLKNRNYTVIIKQDQDYTKGSGSGGAPRIIVGAVPQALQLSQGVGWATPFGAGLAGSGMVADILAATGNRLVGQVMTMQVWQGGSGDFQFSVEFELRAWSDPVRDVLEPLRTLLKMSLPNISDSGFLQSPGPILTSDSIEAISGQVTGAAANIVSAAVDAVKSQFSTSDGGGAWLGSKIKSITQAVEKSGIARKDLIEKHMKNKISIQIGRWFYLDNVVVSEVNHNIKTQTPERRTGIVQSASVQVVFKPVFALTSEDVDSMLRSGGAAMTLEG